MEITDQIRGFCLMSTMLENRVSDPYCSACNSFNAALTEAKDMIKKFESQNKADIGALIDDFPVIFMEAKKLIASIEPSNSAIGQKKAGNCTLPDGICYSKMSLSTVKKIREKVQA